VDYAKPSYSLDARPAKSARAYASVHYRPAIECPRRRRAPRHRSNSAESRGSGLLAGACASSKISVSLRLRPCITCDYTPSGRALKNRRVRARLIAPFLVWQILPPHQYRRKGNADIRETISQHPGEIRDTLLIPEIRAARGRAGQEERSGDLICDNRMPVGGMNLNPSAKGSSRRQKILYAPSTPLTPPAPTSSGIARRDASPCSHFGREFSFAIIE